MITRGFKPVGWVAAVGAAALGCYMLSLQVASERADLTSLERRIVETRQQIRALQTELGTRGRLQQLEQWNDEVLALAAPGSGQFLASEAQLARFTTTTPPVLDGAAEIRMASATPTPTPTPAPAPAPAAGVPAAQRAVATPQRSVAPPPALQQPMVQRASLTVPPQAAAPAPARTPPAPARTRTPSVEPRAAVPASPVRTRTRTASAEPAPARRASLLDERTLRDIGTAARAERRGGTRD
ncbi:MAG: hypothetical protein QOG13_1028 [Sphingomonadales bacterium]|jgi:hypothetical protein|nr:hypothetical protein [Sphingomonadales bacterium]